MAEDRPDSPPPRIPYRPPGIVFIDEGTDGADTGIIGRKRRADFRGRGVVVTDGGDRAIITIEPGAFFCYDYLVDTLYTGTEGAVISSPDTAHTFKRYSTVKGAVDDANANRQANGQSTSFLICGAGTFEARYQEAAQINLAPPSAGSYHFFGTGADTTKIDGTMASGALFNISTLSLDSQVEFHHIEMKTNESIALIQGGGSTRIALDNCWLRPNNGGARAIDAGSGAVGWNVANTNFEGTGIGIDGGALMNVRLTNCYVAMTVGIRMANAAQVYCTNVKFNCSSRDVEIGATAGAFSFSAGGACEFNKGIYFIAGAGPSSFDNFGVNGCIFILGSGETGIDYSGVTGVDGLLDSEAHSIVGNTFRGSGTAKGIVGGSAQANGPHCITFTGNTFEGFTADNEIIDMDLTGDNIVAHNCTDSGATLHDSHDDEGVISKIIDTDGDTSVDTEESADEDKIRFKTGGVQRALLDAIGFKIYDRAIFGGDDLFYATTDPHFGGNPRNPSFIFDTNDWIEFERSTSKYSFYIAEQLIMKIGVSAGVPFIDTLGGRLFVDFIVESFLGDGIVMQSVVKSFRWEPITDNTYDLGTASKRWRDLYLAGTIVGGASISAQFVGSGTLGADQAPATSASWDLVATDKALLLNRLTTAQRDALTAVDGMILYNVSAGEVEMRHSGAWFGFRHDSVTMSGTPDYITISGQHITRGLIDLAAHVTGLLPEANIDSDIARVRELHAQTHGVADHTGIVGERQVEIVIPLKKALPAATNNATLDDDYLYKKPYNVARRINKWYIRFESNLAAEAIFELRKNGTVLTGSSITIAASARDAAIDSFTEVTLADGDSLEVWQVGGNAEDIGGRATAFGDEDIVAAVS